MTQSILAYSVLVTAILESGEEKNLILRVSNNKTIYKVHHEGFVSVSLAAISSWERESIGIGHVSKREINLNEFWLYEGNKSN